MLSWREKEDTVCGNREVCPCWWGSIIYEWCKTFDGRPQCCGKNLTYCLAEPNVYMMDTNTAREDEAIRANRCKSLDGFRDVWIDHKSVFTIIKTSTITIWCVKCISKSMLNGQKNIHMDFCLINLQYYHDKWGSFGSEFWMLDKSWYHLSMKQSMSSCSEGILQPKKNPM